MTEAIVTFVVALVAAIILYVIDKRFGSPITPADRQVWEDLECPWPFNDRGASKAKAPKQIALASLPLPIKPDPLHAKVAFDNSNEAESTGVAAE